MASTQLMNHWDMLLIKQYEEESGQALLRDEQTLVSFSQDFGKLVQSKPAAVCAPKDVNSLEHLIQYANKHKLPITIRAYGLSQCGQTLPVAGGLTLSMQHFKQCSEVEDDAIWVEANASWMDLLQKSLVKGKAPYVLPYNCNLSIAGVLSVGGVGAASFKYGFINAYVQALEVIDGNGTKQIVDANSPLFHACLSGLGRFAVITRAQIRLRAVKPRVKTFYLVYSEREDWFADLELLKSKVDYVELFCSPSLQGAKLLGNKRVPAVQWLYALHISKEYEQDAPELADIADNLRYWEILSEIDEGVSDYLLRHNSRFDMMKNLGQWDLVHPWYECFMPTELVKKHLPEILQELPVHFANLVHVVPIANKKADWLMFPEADSVCSFMILNPGLPEVLKDSCVQAVEKLDARLLGLGGKRYLSGFLGFDVDKEYWVRHYGKKYGAWQSLKNQYDPQGIFSSLLQK